MIKAPATAAAAGDVPWAKQDGGKEVAFCALDTDPR